MGDLIIHFRLKALDRHTPTENQNNSSFKFTEQFFQHFSEWERLVFKAASEHIVNKAIGSENKHRIRIEISTSDNPNKKEPYPHE